MKEMAKGGKGGEYLVFLPLYINLLDAEPVAASVKQGDLNPALATKMLALSRASRSIAILPDRVMV